jgi:hypothetical protein
VPEGFFYFSAEIELVLPIFWKKWGRDERISKFNHRGRQFIDDGIAPGFILWC